ncbi:MAG: PASTA domain-containing protein, partial [Mucinivorans sp.]
MLNIFTRHGQQYIVPDMIGLAVDQTDELTSQADLEIVVIDSLFVPGEKAGAILDQDPKPTARVKSGRKVFVVVNAISPKMD